MCWLLFVFLVFLNTDQEKIWQPAKIKFRLPVRSVSFHFHLRILDSIMVKCHMLALALLDLEVLKIYLPVQIYTNRSS